MGMPMWPQFSPNLVPILEKKIGINPLVLGSLASGRCSGSPQWPVFPARPAVLFSDFRVWIGGSNGTDGTSKLLQLLYEFPE